MNHIPGLGLKFNTIAEQLCSIIDDGECGGRGYTGLWLASDRFPGNPGEFTTWERTRET